MKLYFILAVLSDSVHFDCLQLHQNSVDCNLNSFWVHKYTKIHFVLLPPQYASPHSRLPTKSQCSLGQDVQVFRKLKVVTAEKNKHGNTCGGTLGLQTALGKFINNYFILKNSIKHLKLNHTLVTSLDLVEEFYCPTFSRWIQWVRAQINVRNGQ